MAANHAAKSESAARLCETAFFSASPIWANVLLPPDGTNTGSYPQPEPRGRAAIFPFASPMNTIRPRLPVPSLRPASRSRLLPPPIALRMGPSYATADVNEAVAGAPRGKRRRRAAAPTVSCTYAA